jgi:hypothetical protein
MGRIRTVKRSLITLIKQAKYAWMAPFVMLLALAIPNSFIFLKFLAVMLALGLFYTSIASYKFLKGIIK